ncbi:MAG: SDR family oxidoreductase [Synergistaceae bacterium]|nr:SDR family oxidoreductase [Synergistaceae bacterium]
MKLLEGKTAIITGSSRGIGRSIAMAFAYHGAGLVIHGTNEAQLKALADELGCAYVAGDIGEFSTSERLAEKCLSRFGRIDILVNNAGINSRTKFIDLTPEEWDKILRVNLSGTFYTCKCVIPHMLEQKAGVIINMSSRAGKTAHPTSSACYGASKAGIDALTRKLAYDFGPEGIRVNSICPGPIETDMSKQWTPDYREKLLGNIPLRHLGTGEDIASLAVYLASDLAGFITGESININGGTYMN